MKGRSVFQMIWGRMQLLPRVQAFDTRYELYWLYDRSNLELTKTAAARRASWMIPYVESGDSVLDIGCGTGEMLDSLRRERYIEGTGLDVSTTALQSLREKGFSGLEIDLTGTGNELPDVYDHITMFEVLEHVQDAETLLMKLWGRYRKAVYVTIPNSGYLPYRLRLLFGKFPMTYLYDPREHIRFWTVSDFKVWVSWLGFRECEVRNGHGRIKFLARLWPSLFASSILYVIR